MANQSINDWVVELGFDTTAFDKGVKRVEKSMQRLAKMQAKLNKGFKQPTLNITAPQVTGTSRKPSEKKIKGFQLADEKQLRLANTIESVIRRGNRQLGASSDEFKKISKEAQVLKGSIAGIKSPFQLEQLNNRIRILRDNITASSQAIRRNRKEMDTSGFSAKKFAGSLKNLAAGYASIFAVLGAGKFIFETGKLFDSLSASLLAASGSTEAAAADFEFIKETSFSLGIGLKEVAEGYKQIGTAGRFSNLTTEQTRDIFLGATEASRAFGLSADRSALVFRAFSQILSKGKVTQEELRQQLGEQIPAAMSIAAKAMGVTTAELNKMITAGIPATEFLPKFAAELRKSVSESGALAESINSVTAAQQRFNSSLQLLTIEAFDAGAKTGLVFFFNELSKSVTNLAPLFRVLGKVMNGVGRVLGVVVRGITTILRPVLIFSDVMTDLFSSLLFGTDVAGGFNSVLFGMGRALKFIVGLLLFPIGLIDRFINKWEELQKNVFGGSALQTALNLDTVISQAAQSGLKTLGFDFGNKTPTATNKQINSGNNITVTVDANGNDAEGIADTINSMFQDMFSGAEANN